MNQVLTLWEERLVLVRQGIYFQDGSARELTIEPTAVGGMSVGDPIDVDAVLSDDPEDTTSVDAVLAEAMVRGSGRVLLAGECDYGSDGYFALLEPDRSLLWLAFFDSSNPFVTIDLHGNVAVLRSSNGTTVSVRTDTMGFVPAAPES